MSPSTPPTLWVHVTTLLNWTRPPVGIVRVEQEYARAMLDRVSREPVRFCRFDAILGSFLEVSPETVRAKLDLAAQCVAAAPAAEVAPAAASPSDLKRAVRRTLVDAVRRLPPVWQVRLKANARLAWRVLSQSRTSMRAGIRRAVNGLRHWSARKRPPSHPFAPGDRLVSLGLDWDTLDQRLLYRLKRQLNLNIILACYDVIPMLYPQLVTLRPGSFAAYFTDMAWCADAILCISWHTRADCEATLRRLGTPVPPTHVIRLGAEVRADGRAVPPAGLPLDRPFVLFVSTIERRKNHEVLYRAWVRLREQGFVPHRLVFVGMKGWGVDDLLNDLRLDPVIQDDIVCLNHVSDAELAWLYQHCAFTAFPSLYEGWGLPVAESLAWGKFCLASNRSSVPEAGGSFAEYLDPWDLPAWVDRLSFYMRHPRQVQERNERIVREYTPPRWTDTAAQIHAVVQGAAGSVADRSVPLSAGLTRTPESA